MLVKERQMISVPGQFLTHLWRKLMQLLLIYGKYDRSDYIIYASSQSLCTPLIVSSFLFSIFCSGISQLLHFQDIFFFFRMLLSIFRLQLNSIPIKKIPFLASIFENYLHGNIRKKISIHPHVTSFNILLKVA